MFDRETRYVVKEVGEPMMEDGDSHGIVQTRMDTSTNGVIKGLVRQWKGHQWIQKFWKGVSLVCPMIVSA